MAIDETFRDCLQGSRDRGPATLRRRGRASEDCLAGGSVEVARVDWLSGTLWKAKMLASSQRALELIMLIVPVMLIYPLDIIEVRKAFNRTLIPLSVPLLQSLLFVFRLSSTVSIRGDPTIVIDGHVTASIGFVKLGSQTRESVGVRTVRYLLQSGCLNGVGVGVRDHPSLPLSLQLLTCRPLDVSPHTHTPTATLLRRPDGGFDRPGCWSTRQSLGSQTQHSRLDTVQYLDRDHSTKIFQDYDGTRTAPPLPF
jgi:hypothetical protein